MAVTSKKHVDTPLVHRNRSEQLLSDTEERQMRQPRAIDAALWQTPMAPNKELAQFYGNLNNKLLAGISQQEIKKMTVRDRVTAARVCYDMRQLELDRPTSNISLDLRKQNQELLPALQAELARREKERKTIDVTPREEQS